MAAGVIAAALAFLFAFWAGEPQIDLAIAVEQARDAAAHAPHGPELVSRGVQKTAGLFTAVGLYGAAVGGLFALAFAVIYGRLAAIGPRSLALLLAVAAFVAVGLTPALKYPPTPPAVGQHDTVAFRTVAYFGIILLSLAGATLAAAFARRLRPRAGGFNAVAIGTGAYVVTMALVAALLPPIDEVPADFPAVVLWNFRLAAIGMQAVLWIALGLIFGWMAEAALLRSRRQAVRA